MTLTHWLDSLKGSFRQRGLRRKSRRRWASKHSTGRTVAGIEVLEDRTLLTPIVGVAPGPGDAYEDLGGAVTGGFLVFVDYLDFGESITVGFSFSTSSTAKEGVDYATITEHFVEFSDADLIREVLIVPVDDTFKEGDETVIITLDVWAGTGTEYDIDSNFATQTVKVFDDDATDPLVSIEAIDATAVENSSDTGTFRVTRTGDTSLPLDVEFSVDGTADVGTDYVALSQYTPHKVTILANDTFADITVTTLNDNHYDPDETVVVTLEEGTANYDLQHEATTDTVTITNDDPIPSISISANDPNAAEEGTDPGQFTITRTGATGEEIMVNYSLTGSTISVGDYNSNPTLTNPNIIPFGVGQTTAVITITPVDDDEPETNEKFVLKIEPGTGYQIVSGSSSDTVTIADNDALVSMTTDDGAAAETPDGSNPGQFTFTRTGFTSGSLTVPYTVTGTTVSGDIVSIPALDGTLEFNLTVTNVPVVVTPFDDLIPEGVETIFVELDDPIAGSGYEIDANAKTGTITIARDDQTFTITAADTDAAEDGTDPGQFTITRTGNISDQVWINLDIDDGDAESNDYNSSNTLSTSISFSGGETSRMFVITPVDDSDQEADETLTVTINAGAGYEVGSGNSVTVTIVDDDLAVPTMTAPTPTTTTDTTPRIDWTDVSGATSYDLDVTENGNPTENYTGLNASEYTMSTRVAPNSFTARVRAVSATKSSPWTALYNFSLALPNPPTVTGPLDPTSDLTPTITWTPPATLQGVSYEILMYQVSIGLPVYNVTGVTGTQHELPISDKLLVNNEYQIFMRTANSEGDHGTYSPLYVFHTVAPGAPTLTGPPTPTPFAKPTITWTPSTTLPGVTNHLQIYNVDLGQLVYDTAGLIGVQHDVTTALNSGYQYSAYIQAANDNGDYGVFSAPYYFDVVLPMKPVVTGPTSPTGDTTPTITWTSVDGAATYNLLVYDVSAGAEVINQTGLATPSYTPASGLLIGATYQVFAGAVNDASESGPWSAPYYFDVIDVTIDISVDSNNDGTIDSADELVEDDSPGLIVMYNSDDDDSDGTTDSNQTGTIIGEDDLSEVQLSLAAANDILSGYGVRLGASSGGEFVRIWDSADKGNEIPLGTTWNIGSGDPEGHFPNTVWMEGYDAGFTTLEFVLLNQGGIEEGSDASNSAVIKVETISVFESNNVSNDNPDGTNGTPAFGGGYRVFPGATAHNGTTWDNRVLITVTTTPAILNTVVYFKSFDVDDPSGVREIDPNDWAEIEVMGQTTYLNDGPMGRDNVGTFANAAVPTAPGPSTANGYNGMLQDITHPGGNPSGVWGADGEKVLALTDATGRASVYLAASFAPGDNFRVAATTNSDLLDKPLLPPTTGDIAGFTGKLTKQISVWRRFHIEQDLMTSTVSSDWATTVIINSESYAPNPAYSWVTVSLTSAVADEYKGGILRTDDNSGTFTNYPVIANTAGPIVKVLVKSTGLSNSVATLYQDDYIGPGGIVPITAVNTDNVSSLYDFMKESAKRSENRFADAYLQPELDSLDTFDSKIAATPHVTSISDAVGTGRGSAAVGIERDVFWVVYLSTAYEYLDNKDRDGLNESSVLGVATGDNEMSLVFVETVSDFVFGNPGHGLTSFNVKSRTAVHEVGHQFFTGGLPLASEHRDTPPNIMSSSPIGIPDNEFYFHPAEIRTMRTRHKSPGS